MKAEHRISALPRQVRRWLYNLFLVARGQLEETSAETSSLNLGVGYLREECGSDIGRGRDLYLNELLGNP